MNLFILRHGLAVEPGTHRLSRDSDRRLTPKGKRKVGEVARAMRAMELSFDSILTSPYVRARQTAEIVAEELRAHKRLGLADELKPGGSMDKLIRRLGESGGSSESVLLVGHEPYLSSLISWLVFGETGASITMKKAGLCKLTAERLEGGRCASLEWLLPPRMLAGIG
jgi:phosphohistidine phosphatase